MNNAITAADKRFTDAMAALCISASINAQAVEAVFAWNNHDQSNDSAAMLANSLALGMRQLYYLNSELKLLAIDYELAHVGELV